MPETVPDARMEAFAVRPAEPGDAGSFVQVYRTVAAERRYIRTESVRRPERFYRRQFRRSWTFDQAWLVAEAGEVMVGHLGVAREDDPANRHVASLGVAVLQEWRGRGVGSGLMSECLRWAGEFGVEKLALSVYPDNHRALALYGKFGFQVEGRLTGHSKKSIGYRDEVLMGRWLIDPPDGSGEAVDR
jgi:RimJ/RimL family protein N-acetyltransferase